MSDYIVVFETFGTFHDLAMGPTTLVEARKFVADPPTVWQPRQQDRLSIYRLEPVEDDE